MTRNVARGSLLGMVGQGWHLVTAFLLYAFLARRLGPTMFGTWSIVLSVLAWFEVFVTSSIVRVTTKAISEAPSDAPRLTRAAYLGQAVVAAVVFGTVQIVAGPVARALSDPGLAGLIRIAALDIPLYAMFMIASAAVLGAERYERQGVAWLVYATAKAGFVAALVAAGFSVPGALVGNALSSLVGFAVLFIVPGPGRQRLAQLWPTARSMMVLSLPFLALSLVEGVGQHVDLWLVSALVSDGTRVGLYASATVLAEIPVFLFLGLNRVIFPSVAGARAAGDPSRADLYITQAVRTALIVTVFGVGFAVAAGHQAIEVVYSAAYAPAFVPLVLLMAAGMGRTIQAVCTEVLMAEDRRRVALTILGATVAGEVVLVAFLAARYGPAGAAAGTAASAGVAAGWAALTLRSALGTRPLATLARALGAAAVLGVGLSLLPPAAAWLPLVFPAAVAVYFGVLTLLREFSAEDLASMRSAIGR